MTEEVNYLYVDMQAVERGELELFGVLNNDFDASMQASINDLNYDMYRQKRLLSLGLHPDNELCPWNGHLVVAEGIYCWDENEEEYKIIKA